MRNLIRYERAKPQLMFKDIINKDIEIIANLTKRYLHFFETYDLEGLYKIFSEDVFYSIPDSYDKVLNPSGLDFQLKGIDSVFEKIKSKMWLNKKWLNDFVPYYEFGYLNLIKCNYPCIRQTKRSKLTVQDISIFEKNNEDKISLIELYSFHEDELNKIFAPEEGIKSYAKH